MSRPASSALRTSSFRRVAPSTVNRACTSFFTVEIERSCSHVAFGEQLSDFACLGIRECDERLFRSPEVERSLVFPYCLLKALNTAVNVRIKQGEKSAEVLSITLVGRCGHQQKMVCHSGE